MQSESLSVAASYELQSFHHIPHTVHHARHREERQDPYRVSCPASQPSFSSCTAAAAETAAACRLARADPARTYTYIHILLYALHFLYIQWHYRTKPKRSKGGISHIQFRSYCHHEAFSFCLSRPHYFHFVRLGHCTMTVWHGRRLSACCSLSWPQFKRLSRRIGYFYSWSILRIACSFSSLSWLPNPSSISV